MGWINFLTKNAANWDISIPPDLQQWFVQGGEDLKEVAGTNRWVDIRRMVQENDSGFYL
jgi:hypothetical protein